MPSPQQHPRRARAAAPPPIETVEGKLPSRPARPRSRAAIAAAAAPAPPVTPTSAIDTAPLRLFELSELNVRKTYGEPEIAEMARDLALRGQLQNLIAVVTETGTLAVIAGGRRLRAFWLLRAEGKVDADHEICFKLADPVDGRETSLAENIHKLALNPVDEIRAYAAIVADHTDRPDPLAYCAHRQGVTRAHVERMLRLAELAPAILDALLDGRIDIAAAQAYAATSDHEAQLAVFMGEERRGFGTPHRPASIRDAIRGRSYPAAVPQALYVGLDAYREAGGRIDRELFFGEDGGERLLDPALLDALAVKKALAEFPARADADGLLAGTLVNGFNPMPSWPKPPATHIRSAVPIDRIDPAIRALSIGVYNLARDGAALELAGVMTPVAMPAPAAAAQDDAAGDVAAWRERPARAPARPEPSNDRREAAEVIQARLHDQLVQRGAAFLAAHKLATTALGEDRLVMQPLGHDVFHETIELADDGDILVTIQVRVRPAELEQMRAAAEEAIAADPPGGGVDARQPVSEAA